MNLQRRLAAEAIGTAMLLAAVVGSGIMGDRLASGNVAIALSPTSFANPAVTMARALTNPFTGIRPIDAPGFIAAQLAGALVATLLFRWLVPTLATEAKDVVVPGRQDLSAS
jgi:glycerol uptake facilitator-like aquaporin